MRNLPKRRAEHGQNAAAKAPEARAARKVKHAFVAQMLHSPSPGLW